MDIIIVKTAEDMERITTWVKEFIHVSEPEQIDFRIPFRHGKIHLPFELCSLEFESDEKGGRVFFKLYANAEYLKNNGDCIGSFSVSLPTFEVLDEQYGAVNERILKFVEKNKPFEVYTQQWLVLMMLALYYRPEFESNCQSREAHSAGRKKGKKVKRVKTLYTRTYVITGDITDKLPKPVKKHTKPDHEFSVRGHFRQYKSGKRVWVNPHVRCKGRKPSEGSAYIAKIAGGESHDNS